MAYITVIMKLKTYAIMRMLIGVKTVTTLINNHGARLVKIFFTMLIMTIVIHDKKP